MSINDAVKNFLPVYSGSRVDGTTFLTPRKRYKIGGFSVMPLPVEHGGCENVAYVVDHDGMGRVLFITDAESFPYKIDGVEHLLVECNYSNEIRFNKQLDGDSVRSNSEAHMELETTLDVVRRHYSEKLASVVLLHLSAKLSDEKAFKQAVEGICPLVDVYVAQGGLKIDFNVF
jgi:phosphoribosyl 1,2-cyclic phosphodiesterase